MMEKAVSPGVNVNAADVNNEPFTYTYAVVASQVQRTSYQVLAEATPATRFCCVETLPTRNTKLPPGCTRTSKSPTCTGFQYPATKYCQRKHPERPQTGSPPRYPNIPVVNVQKHAPHQSEAGSMLWRWPRCPGSQSCGHSEGPLA